MKRRDPRLAQVDSGPSPGEAAPTLLSAVPTGETVTLVCVLPAGRIGLRLAELGLTPEAHHPSEGRP